MDNQTSSLLNWNYNLYQEKSMDELRQSLAVAMEIEEIRLKAQEDLKSRDLEISQLKALLSAAIKERDEAQEICRKACCCQHALLQNQLQKKQKRHHHHLSALHSGGSSSVEDACDEIRSIGSSSPPPRILPEQDLPVGLIKMPLPENGKLLQAVVKAGPLLQTLLIAGGPLPQWRHPPPPVGTFQIPPPPVVMPASPLPTMSATRRQESLRGNINSCGNITRKREHE